ncbi:hypothetical protein [Fodinibius saliphilus]|uniref:hypothetical protein n=1 Tax=Fodinibius saliphilus TaxID=1920650 RepID=UPI001109BB58|nr:hypothetical protein [Fodinibius saliphilus]
MLLFYRALLLWGLILLPYTLFAQNATPEQNSAKVDTIFESIHLDRQLFETSTEMQSFISQNPFGLSAAQNKKMLELYKKAFTKQFLLSDAHDKFHKNINSQYADSTLQWLDQEHTQIVLSAEENYYTLQGIRKRVVHRYEIEKDPPSQHRTFLIKSLGQKMEVKDIQLESKTILFRALVKAFNELNQQRSFSDAQLEGIVTNYQSQIKANMEQEVQTQLLLTYYEIDDHNLRTFASFYDTESGSWLNATKSASIYYAYQKAADRFLESVRSL